jgi:hypothetical protein
MHEFASNCLTKGRFWHFSSRFLKSYSQNRMKHLGMILASIAPLNVFESFPLIFLIVVKEHVLKESVTIEDLEYFASERDPEAFRHLREVKNNQKLLQDTGFDTYEQALFHFCELDNETLSTTYSAIIPMATEFVSRCHVVVNGLNIGSLMAYLVDKKSQMISRDEMIFEMSKSLSNEIKKEIIERIRSLNDASMSNLIYNMSGSSVISLKPYKFTFGEFDAMIEFQTCFNEVSIDIKYLGDLDLLFAILTAKDTSYNTA